MPENDLRKGMVLVRSRLSFKVNGPAMSYSSAEFGYEMEMLVPDNKAAVEEATRQMDSRLEVLCELRRNRTYRQLIRHVNAIENRSWAKKEGDE